MNKIGDNIKNRGGKEDKDGTLPLSLEDQSCPWKAMKMEVGYDPLWQEAQLVC